MIHKVKYLLPGVFMPEEEIRTLSAHDPAEAAAKAPHGTYCFTLYDVAEAPDLGPEFTVLPKPQNKSGRFYMTGALFTLPQVEAMGEDKRVLASNMRCNGWDRMILCGTGNWQPFMPEDTLLTEVASR